MKGKENVKIILMRVGIFVAFCLIFTIGGAVVGHYKNKSTRDNESVSGSENKMDGDEIDTETYRQYNRDDFIKDVSSISILYHDGNPEDDLIENSYYSLHRESVVADFLNAVETDEAETSERNKEITKFLEEKLSNDIFTEGDCIELKYIEEVTMSGSKTWDYIKVNVKEDSILLPDGTKWQKGDEVYILSDCELKQNSSTGKYAIGFTLIMKNYTPHIDDYANDPVQNYPYADVNANMIGMTLKEYCKKYKTSVAQKYSKKEVKEGLTMLTLTEHEKYYLMSNYYYLGVLDGKISMCIDYGSFTGTDKKDLGHYLSEDVYGVEPVKVPVDDDYYCMVWQIANGYIVAMVSNVFDEFEDVGYEEYPVVWVMYTTDPYECRFVTPY